MKKIQIIFTLLFSAMIFAGAVNGQADNSKTQDKVFKMKEVDERPQITSKPSARTYGKCGLENGTAQVRVVLRKSGEVSDIKFKKVSPCVAFNDSVLAAAKKVKFVPGKKDGQPVSISIILEYSYWTY